MWQDGKSYNPWRAYGQSKTANILFSFDLGKKLQKRGVAVFAVHPGGELMNLAMHPSSPRLGRANFLWDVVVMQSLLLPNSNVTEDLFMEAYKMAVERNNGINPWHTFSHAENGTKGSILVLILYAP